MGDRNHQIRKKSNPKNIWPNSNISISTVQSKRKVVSVSAASFDSIPGSNGKNEYDSNADTCCLGKNWRILEYTCRTSDVYSYDHTKSPITGVPIVYAATS